MSGVAGDFDDFVAARWRELHAVATVTTGDPHAAARETASALAELGRRWQATTDTGTPTATARAAVLTAALTAAARGGVTPPTPAEDAEPDPEGSVRAALATVLAGAAPTARAALAVRHWWDEPPALVAACSTSDLDTVRAGLATLEQRLGAAHAEAVGRAEVEVGWALAAAVADALEAAVDDAPVADPVALVAERTRGARRRTRRVAVGAALVLALVGAASAFAWTGRGADQPTVTDPDDPGWAVVTTWTPRGPLVDDPTVRSVAAHAHQVDPAGRLLYAGPVGDTLAVVMTDSTGANTALPEGVPGPALGEGFDKEVFLRLWTAPARLGAAALAPTAIEGEPTARTTDLVALSVDQDTPGAPPTMLVLSRPSITDGFVVTGAVPQPDGSVRPVVVGLRLVDGVATFAPTGVGFTPEVGVAGYRGVPAGALTNSFLLPSSGPADDLAAAQRILLAGVTGHRPDSLATISVLEAVVPASVADPDYVGTYPDFVGTHPKPLRVTVVTTTTRDGARVRSTRLAASTGDGPWTYLERLAAVPTTDPHALLLLPTGKNPRFVAIAPDGATAELVTSDGHVRDSATIHDGLATLSSAEDPQGTAFRLRVRAPDGHVVYDAVPPQPVELLDSGAVAD
ncbi:MAG TPA: hypothetical protein VFL10_13950 [Ornithinibacter sp.]|nr:hypothetical protein [Ornithinibacter sp.]